MRIQLVLGLFVVGIIAVFVVPRAQEGKRANSAVLPFQGYLTDAGGETVSDGAKLIQFRLFDAPVGGRAIWAGETHRLTVNGGLVNTILGTRTAVDPDLFASPLYLEITIDADDDGEIAANDPPLLPRQVISPGLYSHRAGDAEMLNGRDWSYLLENSDDEDLAKVRFRKELLDHLADELTPKIVPVGSIVAYYGKREDGIPTGWLLCDGASIPVGGEYDALRSLLGRSVTPDLRGYFLRGLDPEGKVDPDGMNRDIGQVQLDTVGPHQHDFRWHPARSGIEKSIEPNRFPLIRPGFEKVWGGSSATEAVAVNDGVETRPKSVAVNYVIRY